MNWKPFFLIIISLGIGLGLGWVLGARFNSGQSFSESVDQINPLSQTRFKEPPLLKYQIPELAKQYFQAEGPVTIVEKISETDAYSSYVFSYQTQGKKMTGQLNIPKGDVPALGFPVITMLRGFVPSHIYETGVGTRNSAAIYSENGFVTIAPDFLGYGESDSDYEDTWEARFIKPIQVAQLLASITQFPEVELNSAERIKLDPTKMGMWAHSNGGQIALTTLEITGKAIPTTLWAPVTAPFPYSILFFGDELEDEGKEQRAWIALFERDYDAAAFSLSKHLNLLPPTSIQIHHGTADDAALISWSDEFVQKIEAENNRRTTEIEKIEAIIATASSANETQSYREKLFELQKFSAPISTEYFRYPGADHNLQPNWNEVVERDVIFFNEQLLK
jgi:dienelactone hydrolase